MLKYVKGSGWLIVRRVVALRIEDSSMVPKAERVKTEKLYRGSVIGGLGMAL